MTITEQDKEFMREAIRLADESVRNGGGPFGAVIVRDGEIIAGSSNSVTIDNDPTAHAEVNTIRQACRKLGTFDLSDCVIYTSCEPCPMCLGAIYWAHLRCVYYGNTKKRCARHRLCRRLHLRRTRQAHRPPLRAVHPHAQRRGTEFL